MAANSSLNLSSLDFDTLKTNFVTYLKSQDVFKDYDFSGSNMNVLLDIMSYNSYLNSFYLNMVASEMFLDSAQKLDSVVSHAKELNYVPQSTKSSVSFINFTVNTVGISGRFSIPKGTLFSGSNANGTFTFTTKETSTYVSPNSTFAVANLAIYEGTFMSDSYVVDYTNETQKFILSNPNIDTDSLSITVSENNGASNTIFTRVDTLYNLKNTSNVYFLQVAQNNQFEILFGDGIFGRKPQNGAVVSANYRIAKGPAADGISKFGCDEDLGVKNGGQASISTITVSSNSSSGGLPENIETIRFRSPRYFATQQRAVATDDYSSLVLSKFGGQVSDVNVYGGETVEPKQYGTVIVCVKPKGTTQAPDYLKTDIKAYLKQYVSVPTRVQISDPEYIYLKIGSTVQYDNTLTDKFPSDIKNAVLQTIINFSANNLEVFKNDFRYSRFVTSIDDTDVAIISNDTDIELVKRVSPVPDVSTTIVLEYGNAGHREGVYYGQAYPDEPTVYSTAFTYVDANSVEYPSCYLRDDSNGNIFVYYEISSDISVVNPKVGTIDYDTGTVTLNNIRLKDFSNYISVYYRTMSKDLYASRNRILLIDPNDVSINVINKLD